MKYENLRDIIGSILFETTYKLKSTEDHRAGQFDDKNNTIPQELPLSPEENVSSNSIVSRPPVEDESYIPKTPSELSAAVKALSELMGNEEIEKAYSEIKDILKPGGSVKESVLKEYGNYDDFDSFELPDDSDMPEEFRSGYSIEEPEDSSEQEPSGVKISKSSGEASYQDILDAKILPDDVQSISAVKAFITRAQKKQALNTIFGVSNVKKAQGYAAEIWIGALQADGALSPEHAAGFRQNIEGTKDAPGFRAFWQLGFFEPAIKPLVNARNKQVKADIAKLDPPKELVNMMFSQTIGLSPVNGKKIRMKLNDVFPDKSMTDIDELVKKFAGYVKSNYIKYQQEYFKDVDLSAAVKEAWSKKSVDQKIDITHAAMDEAEDFDNKSKKAGLR